jgi:hypothetical protein
MYDTKYYLCFEMPINSNESAENWESISVCDCPNGTWFIREDVLTTCTK